jgi:hypothetical protein
MSGPHYLGGLLTAAPRGAQEGAGGGGVQARNATSSDRNNAASRREPSFGAGASVPQCPHPGSSSLDSNGALLKVSLPAKPWVLHSVDAACWWLLVSCWFCLFGPYLLPAATLKDVQRWFACSICCLLHPLTSEAAHAVCCSSQTAYTPLRTSEGAHMFHLCDVRGFILDASASQLTKTCCMIAGSTHSSARTTLHRVNAATTIHPKDLAAVRAPHLRQAGWTHRSP